MRIPIIIVMAALLAGCTVAHVVTTPVRVAGHVVKTGASAARTAASVVP